MHFVATCFINTICNEVSKFNLTLINPIELPCITADSDLKYNNNEMTIAYFKQ